MLGWLQWALEGFGCPVSAVLPESDGCDVVPIPNT